MHVPVFVLFAAIGGADASGTAVAPAEHSLGWDFARSLWENLRTEDFVAFLTKPILGAWAGFGLGLLAALLAIVAMRRLGTWKSGWRHAAWVRWPLWVLMTLATAICAGLTGAWAGFSPAVEGTLRQSHWARTALPV